MSSLPWLYPLPVQNARNWKTNVNTCSHIYRFNVYSINIERCLVPESKSSSIISTWIFLQFCPWKVVNFNVGVLSVLHSPIAGTSRCCCDMNIDHHHNLGIESTYMHTNLVSISENAYINHTPWILNLHILFWAMLTY